MRGGAQLVPERDIFFLRVCARVCACARAQGGRWRGVLSSVCLSGRSQGRRWRGDDAITVPYFELQGERVWGATAMVLGELLHLMRSNPEGGRRQEAGDRRS